MWNPEGVVRAAAPVDPERGVVDSGPEGGRHGILARQCANQALMQRGELGQAAMARPAWISIPATVPNLILGRIRLMQGLYDEADAAAGRLLEATPDYVPALLLRVSVLAARGKPRRPWRCAITSIGSTRVRSVSAQAGGTSRTGGITGRGDRGCSGRLESRRERRGGDHSRPRADHHRPAGRGRSRDRWVSGILVPGECRVSASAIPPSSSPR